VKDKQHGGCNARAAAKQEPGIESYSIGPILDHREKEKKGQEGEVTQPLPQNDNREKPGGGDRRDLIPTIGDLRTVSSEGKRGAP